MQVGIGLPAGIPGADGPLVIEWARRAEDGPFTSLGVVDRIIYGSYDPMLALAAAAAVTRRMKLATTIIVGLMHSAAVLAKQAASLDALSGGRLVLGMAVGARKEDYDIAEVDFKDRGKRFDEQLATLRNLWEEGSVSPTSARRSGPPILVGSTGDHGFARMARYADGYVHGGGPPKLFARAADKARAAWADAGRPGKPMLWAQGYFALGDESDAEKGMAYMRNYYAFTGPFAERIASGLLTTPQDVAQFVRGYAEAGCDELVLFPTLPNIGQLERLADAVGVRGEG